MTGDAAADRWALTLYVDGVSTNSIHAIETVRRVCDEKLGGHADLEVVNLHQQPALARRDHIVAAPTLVRHRPGPVRRVVGDLDDDAWASLGLDPGSAAVSDRHAHADG